MKTLVFDFGNVVGFFDHDKTLAKMRDFTKMTRDAMYAAVYTSELEDNFEKGHIDEAEFLRRVIALWELACPADVLAQAIADIFVPNPEVCDLIPRLASRYRLVLGSNTNILHARKFQAQFADVLGHFQHRVLSHEIGVRKPHVDFFHHCVRHSEAKAEECVFIDDIAANIAGAYEVGMKGIVYRTGDGLVEKLGALGVMA